MQTSAVDRDSFKAEAAFTAAMEPEEAHTPDFLKRCLRKARLEPDLIQDVADACELNELDAVALAKMPADEIANKLFLMQDEARLLLKACRRQCQKLGMSFGEGQDEDLDVPSEQDEPEPAAAPGKRMHGLLSSVASCFLGCLQCRALGMCALTSSSFLFLQLLHLHLHRHNISSQLTM
jgi:hypothetical protein